MLLDGHSTDTPAGQALQVHVARQPTREQKLEGLEWRDQVVQEFAAQHTPNYIIVLSGEGMYSGGDGKAELPAQGA